MGLSRIVASSLLAVVVQATAATAPSLDVSMTLQGQFKFLTTFSDTHPEPVFKPISDPFTFDVNFTLNLGSGFETATHTLPAGTEFVGGYGAVLQTRNSFQFLAGTLIAPFGVQLRPNQTDVRHFDLGGIGLFRRVIEQPDGTLSLGYTSWGNAGSRIEFGSTAGGAVRSDNVVGFLMSLIDTETPVTVADALRPWTQAEVRSFLASGFKDRHFDVSLHWESTDSQGFDDRKLSGTAFLKRLRVCPRH
jgi:hypothetical protein